MTAIIHMLNTLAYSVRLAGVRTKRLAISLSLFNLMFLLASAANTIQAPLLSSIVELSVNRALALAPRSVTAGELLSQTFYRNQLTLIARDIRMVILAATVGTALGSLLMPTFISVFARTIVAFECLGSVPRLVWHGLHPVHLQSLRTSLRPPRPRHFATVRNQSIPKNFLAFNVFVTAVYTTGVLSALYAGALLPQFRSTATLLSSVVNGVATILAATVVDPTAAVITDQALRGERPEWDVKSTTAFLALTRLLGTVLAQALFVPAAWFIRWVTHLIV
ncbi:MAG TPA: DUF2837 family protein [Firmicutes bacterium]|nr:DUF2837 family protein [Bacillota bacterium]